MIDKARWMYEKLSQVHDSMYNDLDSFKQSMKDMSVEDLTDIGYFFREVAKYAEAIEKEFRLASEAAGKIIGLKSLETGDVDVKGSAANAKVDIEFLFDIPYHTDERYEEFCEFLQIPRHVLVKLNWKAIQQHLNSVVADGGRVPDTLVQKRPSFKVTYVKRRK